jgi:hypothetical protein
MFRTLDWQGPQRRSYGPELLSLMQRAFDEAWAAHGIEGAADAKALRECLARAIFDFIDQGERDLRVISAHALDQLARIRNPAPSSPASPSPH